MEFKCLNWRLRSLLSPLSSLVSPPPPSPFCPLSSWFLTSVVLSLRVMLLWFQHKLPKKKCHTQNLNLQKAPQNKTKVCTKTFSVLPLLFCLLILSFHLLFLLSLFDSFPILSSLVFLLQFFSSLLLFPPPPFPLFSVCLSVNWLKKSHSKFDPPKNFFVLSSLLSLPSFFSSSFSLSFFFWKSLFHQRTQHFGKVCFISLFHQEGKICGELIKTWCKMIKYTGPVHIWCRKSIYNVETMNLQLYDATVQKCNFVREWCGMMQTCNPLRQIWFR